MPKKSNSVQKVSKRNKPFLQMTEGWHSSVRGRYVNKDVGADGEKGEENWTSGTIQNLPQSGASHFETRNDRNRGRAGNARAGISGKYRRLEGGGIRQLESGYRRLMEWEY